MSVLQVYLSWANSVLSEVNGSVDNVSGVQEGKVLCEIIDILAPDAGLVAQVQASDKTTQRAYIQTALDHMKAHDIKLTFSAQDIIDGDIKSLLDVMWLLILNYGIHYIGEHGSQRGVGTGKKALLDWCQSELDIMFDQKNTLTFSLCTGNGFSKLLQKFAGYVDESEDKVQRMSKLLREIEERYGIKQAIISATDITDGTVDDHTLMIYLSLLKRRVCNTARRREMYSVEGKEAAMEKERLRSVSEEPPNRRRHSELVTLTQQLQQQQDRHPHRVSRSTSLDSPSSPSARATGQSRSQESVESDWMSSDTNSLISGRERSPGERGNFLLSEAEQVLRQTIHERVREHLPTADKDEDKDTDASLGHSGKETESISEFSSSALDEGYSTNRKDAASKSKAATTKDKGKEEARKQMEKESNGKRSAEVNAGERSTKIRIKRPKDYYLQWEETIDRLSQGPPNPPDVSDMSPRSPRQILRGIEELSPRSPSASSESDVYGSHHLPILSRRDYFKPRPGSLSPAGHRHDPLYAPRSSSLPLSMSQGSKGRSVRRESPRTRTVHIRRTDSGPTTDSQDAQQEITLPDVEGNSNFMERLEEVKRSGRAQRVVLPDLGPDAPVLLIPGQGEEVLLLFDALRQARIDVSRNMAKANGTGEVSNDDSKKPPRSSPSPSLENTDPKTAAHTDNKDTSSSPKTSPQEESPSSSGRLPRPTIHRHRFSKPSTVNLSCLQVDRDGRRAQSLTERSVPAAVNTSSDSPRFHSLSPGRTHSPGSRGFDSEDVTRSPSARNGTRFRGVSMNQTDDGLISPPRRHIPSNRSSPSPFYRSYNSSPVRYSASSSASPFRQTTFESHRSTSPYKLSSPTSPLRVPPLNLPKDLSPSSPRVGGLGRVPRREAWERQKFRKDTNGTDSMAQAKFIEVLCKEIEVLKQKIEVMEESQAESSPERTSPVRMKESTPTGQTGTFYTSQSEIQETSSKMVLAPRGESPSTIIQRGRQSFQPSQSSSSLQPSQRSSPSPRRQYMCASPTSDRPHERQSPQPTRSHVSPPRRSDSEVSPSRHYSTTRDSNVPSSPDTTTTPTQRPRPSSSQSGRGISLGYKSPIRSVTQEIWGKDLTNVEGLDPNRKENYKRLIAQSSLTEEQVIELKQSLASAVVENDILQAKLNNARHEIQEKLSKTNEILDDCRRHLGKSQAENMELRTALEREKDRAQTNEGRVRDLQQIVQQVRADNDELEEELERTLSILDRSKPGIDALKQQNAQLHGQASVIQDENSSLKMEMDDLRKSHFRSVNTIRELRSLLDEVREERSELQHKVTHLERLHNDSKVKSIMTHYQEKGAKDEAEKENSSSGVSSCSDRHTPTFHLPWFAAQGEDVTPRAGSSSSTTTLSISTNTPRSASPTRCLNYSFEELSPTVPSTYREIYPHRKPRYRSVSAERYTSERLDSPEPFNDHPDLQHFPTKLDQIDLNEDFSHTTTTRNNFRKPSSRDTSPVQKPFHPYYKDDKSPSYTSLTETFHDSSRETRNLSPQSRGRPQVRMSQKFRESRSTSSSPRRGLSGERLNHSYDSGMFSQIKRRSASSSPGRFKDSRKGILKNTVSGYGVRSHSPPTRLSPEGKDSLVSKKRVAMRTQAGQLAHDLQQEFEKDDFILDGLRNKHSTKSWFELQLEEVDCSSDAQLPDIVGEEHLLLSEEQRNYANELIKKYTGLKL